MKLKFEKWHGCGNDFLIFWVETSQLKNLLPSFQRMAQKILQRNGMGVGADGILLASKSEMKAFIINSDGTLAETCGNGLRCLAMSSLQDQFEVKKVETFHEVKIHVGNHDFSVAFDSKKKDVFWAYMDFTQIETLEDPAVEKQIKEFNLEIIDSVHFFTAPNPHAVIEVKSFKNWPNFVNFSLKQKQLNKHYNLHWMVSHDDFIEVRHLERGSGETLSCGSGSVCAGVVEARKGFLMDRLKIKTPAGFDLFYESENNRLLGPCEFVFEGIFDL